MSRKERFLGNERVNVEPFIAATNGDDTTDGYAQGLIAQLTEMMGLDNAGRIIRGFRVEIPDQTMHPGDYTVHSGFAQDRLGRGVRQ